MHRPRHARLKYYRFLSLVFPLISFKLGIETRALSPLLFNIVLEILVIREKIKKIQIVMDRIKIFLFAGGISLYVGHFITSPENF